MIANLQLIDLDDFKINGTDDIIIDLYPDRTFKEEIIIAFWKRECLGNIQYYEYFKECDEKDIKVTILCVRNLFPIASQIGHKCIMNTANIKKCISGQLTKHGLERKRLWNEYVDYGSRQISTFVWVITPSRKIDKIIQFYQDRPILMDKKSYHRFEDIQCDLPKDSIWIEAKLSSFKNNSYNISKVIEEATDNRGNIYGVNKTQQLSLVEKHDINDHFLAMQILCSLKRSVRFIGLAGAASLFSVAPLLNVVFVADANDNIAPSSLLYKTYFNEQMYGLRTLGGTYLWNHKYLSFRESYLWDCFLSVLNNKQESKNPKLNIQDHKLPVLDYDFSLTTRERGLLK